MKKWAIKLGEQIKKFTALWLAQKNDSIIINMLAKLLYNLANPSCKDHFLWRDRGRLRSDTCKSIITNLISKRYILSVLVRASNPFTAKGFPIDQ